MDGTTSFRVLELTTEYDKKLEILNSYSESQLADSTTILEVAKDLESLLLHALLLLKVNDLDNGLSLTTEQHGAMKKSVEQCEFLLGVIEQRLAENSSSKEPYHSSRFINLYNHIEVLSVGKGKFTYSWDTAIDLADAQLEEEEQELIAMANTPLPSESSGPPQQAIDKAHESKDSLISLWGDTLYQDALVRAESKKK
mmetsp:Transcript_38650/g.80291  ORF Transcript_38650/g.80291 Transcript_38650/m.80291 type:complete len:198 (-) Transcript_38650:143-736(-)